MADPVPTHAASTGVVTPVAVDLLPLLICTADWDDERLERYGRRLYLQHCATPAKAGNIVTHDGQQVAVFPDDYSHACYMAANKARRGWAKDFVDEARIQRLRWIAPIVGGQVEGTECWRIVERWLKKHPPPEKRLYLVRRERYVVWLLPRGAGGWKLKTAYKPTWADIDAYTSRQTCIWKR